MTRLRILRFLWGERGRNWQQFLWFIFAFFLTGTICALLPTPGAWSDRRSQWMPCAFLLPVNLGLFVATFKIYRRPGCIYKVQAVILWLIFGSVVFGSADALYESFTFLRNVRANHRLPMGDDVSWIPASTAQAICMEFLRQQGYTNAELTSETLMLDKCWYRFSTNGADARSSVVVDRRTRKAGYGDWKP